jgi:uncharacterized membrane protein YfcA
MLAGFTLTRLLVLAALVFFAGIVDALAGGGGLITLPAYLAAGLNPALLLGTNKLSSFLGTIASAGRYMHSLRFPLKPFIPIAVCAVLGSMLGAWLALSLNPAFIRYLLLAALPLVAVAVLIRHDFAQEDRSAELAPEALRGRSCAISAAVGAYDGFFGPGTGTFFALALARWCRHDLLGATGRAKLLNLTTNFAALAVFLFSGRLNIALGLAMAAAGAAGHWLGAHLGLRHGGRLIRPAVALVCAGLFLKILHDTLAAH